VNGREVVYESNKKKISKPLNTILTFKGNRFHNRTIDSEKDEQSFKFWRKGNRIIPYVKTHAGYEIIDVSDTVLVLIQPQLDDIFWSMINKKQSKKL